MRVLLIFVALVVIVMAARRLWGRNKTNNTKKPLAGKMAQCAECGIYIPEQEAIHENQHTFCSKEHRDSYKSKHQ